MINTETKNILKIPVNKITIHNILQDEYNKRSFDTGEIIGRTLGTGIAGATLGSIINLANTGGISDGLTIGGSLGLGLGIYNSKKNIKRLTGINNEINYK